MAATSHTQLLSFQNNTRAAEEMSPVYLVLINSSLRFHLWLPAIIPHSKVPACPTEISGVDNLGLEFQFLPLSSR